ncbi:MAG: XrtA system polysaccharide deacetylase [Planctomycetaceae bacterium]|nr:DUF3473 domain-containing protein [Planctomycetaceae bacterium]
MTPTTVEATRPDAAAIAEMAVAPRPWRAPVQAKLPANMLSFDVEEYFQVQAASSCVKPSQWDSIPWRLEAAVDGLLDLLARHGTLATFFVLGWVARRQGSIIRRIAAGGHEIASHGMTHTMIQHLNASQFAREIRDSRKALEDLSGCACLGYRAPTFSLTHKTAWAIDALIEEGIEYDCSVFPIRHDRYGVPEAPPEPHMAVGPGGGRMLEIPPLTARLLGMNWPVGGGGYFRLLPLAATRAALGAAQQCGRCTMLYLHPWEFDADQPVLAMSRLSRWRHRVGLRRTPGRLAALLEQFRFAPVGACAAALRASDLGEHRYGLTAAAAAGGEKSNFSGRAK